MEKLPEGARSSRQERAAAANVRLEEFKKDEINYRRALSLHQLSLRSVMPREHRALPETRQRARLVEKMLYSVRRLYRYFSRTGQ